MVDKSVFQIHWRGEIEPITTKTDESDPSDELLL